MYQVCIPHWPHYSQLIPTGLLGLLKSIQKPCSLKAFAGQTIGIDAYGWLHRAAVSCSIELAQGKPTSKSVES